MKKNIKTLIIITAIIVIALSTFLVIKFVHNNSVDPVKPDDEQQAEIDSFDSKLSLLIHNINELNKLFNSSDLNVEDTYRNSNNTRTCYQYNNSDKVNEYFYKLEKTYEKPFIENGVFEYKYDENTKVSTLYVCKSQENMDIINININDVEVINSSEDIEKIIKIDLKENGVHTFKVRMIDNEWKFSSPIVINNISDK